MHDRRSTRLDRGADHEEPRGRLLQLQGCALWEIRGPNTLGCHHPPRWPSKRCINLPPPYHAQPLAVSRSCVHGQPRDSMVSPSISRSSRNGAYTTSCFAMRLSRTHENSTEIERQSVEPPYGHEPLCTRSDASCHAVVWQPELLFNSSATMALGRWPPVRAGLSGLHRWRSEHLPDHTKNTALWLDGGISCSPLGLARSSSGKLPAQK